ncbi:MAG: hypothetical protein EB060_00305 [Proteobacteria bacterium]|nr:hypothetical protein [Pseudomonadota bacterium]
MKTLYVLRHAKAQPTSKAISDDHERPLADKGVAMCPLIAEYMKAQKAIATKAICSTSVRTMQTLELTLEALGKTILTDFLPKLYLASPDDILTEVGDVDNKDSSLLIVGHNPGLHQLCTMLAKEGDKKKLKSLNDHFPPGTLAVLESKASSWDNIGRQPATLVDIFYPEV